MANSNIITPYNVTLWQLRKWEVFRGMGEDQLRGIRSFCAFETPYYMGCNGGAAVIFLTVIDEAYGFGHNCNHINILGLPKADPNHRQTNIDVPVKIDGLSHKNIMQISIGGLVGAAISECGTLFWWGNCYWEGDVMPPHSPRNSRRKYLRVSCGYRMMAGLSVSHNVHVWGQVVSNSKILQGDRLVVDISIVDISCGNFHIAMLDSQGFVYTWGHGGEGQRGMTDYKPEDEYMIVKIIDEPCFKIQCGPYSTFCLTNHYELRACGSKADLPLGHICRPTRMATLSKLSLFGAVTHIFIASRSTLPITMAARTADADLFTWEAEHAYYPRISEANSFFEIFTSWELTPDLIHINVKDTIGDLNMPRQRREHYANIIGDVLHYIYLRDRPELSAQTSQFLWKCKNGQVKSLANRITCEGSGREFIMSKFLSDVSSEEQESPDTTRTSDECSDSGCSCNLA